MLAREETSPLGRLKRSRIHVVTSSFGGRFQVKSGHAMLGALTNWLISENSGWSMAKSWCVEAIFGVSTTLVSASKCRPLVGGM